MTDTSAQNFSKPPCHRDDALAVLKRLRERGHTAYFAGGCVRDELLGIEPKDYDVATDAPPARVRELFSKTQAVGAAFGVILVRQGKSVVEVATFRSDGAYLDGRRPSEVHFTTAEADAQRRDFTINGLFLDPLENRVIDYVRGQVDLQSRTLRAIGEPKHRFEEDHLRLLRAVRFAARFDLTIEPRTAEAIVSHAPHLARISPERIADELRRMLTPATRVTAWRMLWELRLLPVILRFLPEHADRPYQDRGGAPLFPLIAPGAEIHFGLALAGLTLCYRISGTDSRSAQPFLKEKGIRESVRACRQALRISNDESDVMEESLRLGSLLEDEPPRVSRIKRFLGGSHAAPAVLLLEALGKSDYMLAPRVEWLLKQFSQLDPKQIAPTPLVTGDDLVAAGLKPGRLFKNILDGVYDAQLENRVSEKSDAMEMALRLASEAG